MAPSSLCLPVIPLFILVITLTILFTAASGQDNVINFDFAGMIPPRVRSQPSSQTFIYSAELVLVAGKQASLYRFAPFVAPRGTIRIDVTVRNVGPNSWNRGDFVFELVDNPYNWKQTSLKMRDQGTVHSGETATYTGYLKAPIAIGIHHLNWRGKRASDGRVFGDSFQGTAEVTCQDSNFCNGFERWSEASQQCITSTVPPCRDSYDCSQDICHGENGTCEYVLMSEDCPQCDLEGCEPDCTDRVCGTDGCGGNCGTCGAGLGCNPEGQCLVPSGPGTCQNPFDLVPNGEDLLGKHKLTGDLRESTTNQIVPVCNVASTAPEFVYKFTVPAGKQYGIVALLWGYDSVLDLRKGTCDGTSVTCSDDAYPPGNLGSRVEALLSEGDYFLIVDAYSEAEPNLYNLVVKFVDNCVPRCNSLFCGDDGCGGDCGPCEEYERCSDFHRCIAKDCPRNCTDRECGGDGCDGSCGECPSGKLCVRDTGKCEVFAECNNEVPTCSPACGPEEYCATNCECFRYDQDLPDLTVNAELLASDNFADNNCAVVEGCIRAAGRRRLLRFSVETVNQGRAPIILPPPGLNPHLFTWSPCHGHFHFVSYATYNLLHPTEPYDIAVKGRKQGYCVYDSRRVLHSPVSACQSAFSCTDQGIQPGWSDFYGWDIDCQWLDITDIAPGEYILFVELNPLRKFPEADWTNNKVGVRVTIPPESPDEYRP